MLQLSRPATAAIDTFNITLNHIHVADGLTLIAVLATQIARSSQTPEGPLMTETVAVADAMSPFLRRHWKRRRNAGPQKPFKFTLLTFVRVLMH
jgi:hypothetical protein